MKKLLLILAALPAFAQTNYIASSGNVSLSSATYAVTLQQPASGQPQVTVTFPKANPQGGPAPVGATIYCSVACVATLARNCTTAASATAGTVTSYLPNQQPAFVTFWTASNASGCTTLRVINIPATQEYPIDLSAYNLATFGATSNLHISIASMTGTVNITFYPLEQH